MSKNQLRPTTNYMLFKVIFLFVWGFVICDDVVDWSVFIVFLNPIWFATLFGWSKSITLAITWAHALNYFVRLNIKRRVLVNEDFLFSNQFYFSSLQMWLFSLLTFCHQLLRDQDSQLSNLVLLEREQLM